VLILAHLACIGTQTLFGGGSVVGKLGVSQGNPVLFALIREGTAGPILCIAAFVINRILPEAKHIPRFLILGACLFGNQLFFIVGLKLSNSITASVWQPTQPIFTCLVALLIRQERFSVWKVGSGAKPERGERSEWSEWREGGGRGSEGRGRRERRERRKRREEFCEKHSPAFACRCHSECRANAGECERKATSAEYVREGLERGRGAVDEHSVLWLSRHPPFFP
jgi:hypothetical protein